MAIWQFTDWALLVGMVYGP